MAQDSKYSSAIRSAKGCFSDLRVYKLLHNESNALKFMCSEAYTPHAS